MAYDSFFWDATPEIPSKKQATNTPVVAPTQRVYGATGNNINPITTAHTEALRFQANLMSGIGNGRCFG